MKMLSYRPRAPLASFVELFWFAELSGSASAPVKERVLPTGTVELVINLQGERLGLFDAEDPSKPRTFRPALIAGPHGKYFVIDASDPRLLGVHFRPGGAFPFLGLPASEVRDQHINLEDLWGVEAEFLRERLLEAPKPAVCFQILEDFLLGRVTAGVQHPAVAFAVERFKRGATSLAEVTDPIGLSARRFRHVFRSEVGLAPKLFWRVQRFQSILGRIRTGRPIDWATLALDCGYFDQSHFIHDFRSFSGSSPTAYHAARVLKQNHIPLPG